MNEGITTILFLVGALTLGFIIAIFGKKTIKLLITTIIAVLIAFFLVKEFGPQYGIYLEDFNLIEEFMSMGEDQNLTNQFSNVELNIFGE